MKDITPMAREAGAQSNAGPQGGPEALSWGPNGPAASSSGNAMNDTNLTRFLGGTPTAVFIRLVLVSLIVGAFLMWLDVRPADILRGVERMINGIFHLGFDAVHLVAEYVLAGAAIVVPIWLVMRLMNYSGKR